jgi:hypothetical protein
MNWPHIQTEFPPRILPKKFCSRIFFFFLVFVFKLRASCLLGRHSPTLITHLPYFPYLFYLFIWIESPLYVGPGLDLFTVLHLAGVTGGHHQAQLFIGWHGVSLFVQAGLVQQSSQSLPPEQRRLQGPRSISFCKLQVTTHKTNFITHQRVANPSVTNTATVWQGKVLGSQKASIGFRSGKKEYPEAE